MELVKDVGSKDIASFVLKGKLGEGSLDALSLCYAPIVGATGLGVYHAFYSFASVNKTPVSFEAVVLSLSLTYRELVSAMKLLEGLGLLQSFCVEVDENNAYWIEVYPPKSVKGFMDDLLLRSKLTSALGEERVGLLLSNLEPKKVPEGAKNVASSFDDVYANGPKVSPYVYGGLKDGPAPLKTGFDRSAFAEGLSSRGASIFALSEAELDYVSKAYALYGYSSHVLGEMASDCLDYSARMGHKLDKKAFLNKCKANLKFSYLAKGKAKPSDISSDSELATKAKKMDEIPPARYLEYKQHGHKPADSDLRLLEKLQNEIGLPAPAINVLIDYVLVKNHNVLSPALCEKIAASLVREGVASARDAMDYLFKVATRGKAKSQVKEEIKTEETPIASMDSEDNGDEEVLSDEELAALYGNLYGEKGKGR